MEITVAVDGRLIGGNSTGDSTYWTSLLAAFQSLRPDGFRWIVFSNAAKPAGIPDSDRVEWRVLPARSSRWWSLVQFPLAAIKAGADVIHTQYSLSPLVGDRGVTTVHDVSFLIGPEWFKPRDRFLLKRTVPAACRRAKRVITVSETSKREIEALIPASRGKVRAVPNACPDWIQKVDRGEAESVLRGLGIQTPFVLTVGTRWPRKNMALALDAMANLPDSIPVQLVVTGKPGWGEESLGKRGLATGFVDEATLSALYSAASLYLAPSRHEGFGIPVLEAFRCGCPVVCSTGGALPEVAGDAAWVEPSWEPARWATVIEQLLRDPGKLEAMRSAGFLRERQFRWEDSLRATLEVYREVADARS